MPPKGWKKYPEGFKPVNSSGAPLREKEQFGIEDLLLPRATMLKLAKDVLPDGSQIPKDGLTVLLRSSTVFINYLTAEANNIAHNAGRKTIVPTDVFKALENINFPTFVPEVRQSLEAYERVAKERAANKALSKASDTTGNQNSEDFMLDDEEEEEQMRTSELEQIELADDLNEPEETAYNQNNDADQNDGEESGESSTKRTRTLLEDKDETESEVEADVEADVDADIDIASNLETPHSS